MEQTQMIAMFGYDIKEFLADVKDSITFQIISKNEGEAAGYAMVAAGVLSDAQEVLARGNVEAARQAMNRAKYLLGKISEITRP